MLNSSSSRPTSHEALGRLDLPDSGSAQVAVQAASRGYRNSAPRSCLASTEHAQTCANWDIHRLSRSSADIAERHMTG